MKLRTMGKPIFSMRALNAKSSIGQSYMDLTCLCPLVFALKCIEIKDYRAS